MLALHTSSSPSEPLHIQNGQQMNTSLDADELTYRDLSIIASWPIEHSFHLQTGVKSRK